MPLARAQGSKSFLVLFFKKELLSFLTRFPCASPLRELAVQSFSCRRAGC